MTPHRAMAVLAAVLTYCLIILGGWVRAANAGLSCPDWPTCYGQWVLTPGDFAALGDVGYTYGQMMLEWTHRFIAGIVLGPLILVLAWLAFAGRGRDPAGFRIALTLLALLLVQASLGAVTVLDRNSPWSVALHLGTALTILAVLVLIALRQGTMAVASVPPFLSTLAAALWIVALLAMTSAAMTAKSGASLACYTWPSCNGSLLPPLDDPLVRIHFIHRATAALTGIGILALLVSSFGSGLRRLTWLSLAATILVAGQIGLGGVLVLLVMPQWTQIAHQATGVLLFALLSVILWTSLAAGRAGESSHEGLSGAREAL